MKITDEEGKLLIRANGDTIEVEEDTEIDTSALQSQLWANRNALESGRANLHEIQARIFDEVDKELDRQYAKHGPQSHSLEMWYTITGEELGEVADAIIENRFREGTKEQIRKEAVETIACLIRLVNEL